MRGRRLLALLACCCFARPGASLAPAAGEEAFIGWEGESYNPNEEGAARKAGSGATAAASGEKQKWIEIVSWKPRAFIYHNFLSNEEADHIKRLAAPMMKRSTVVAQNGSSVQDEYRTSYGTFIKRKADSIVERIEARVAHWSQIPAVHAEDMQVLRYGVGQEYKAHMDTLADETSGPRVCTVLLYLNDVEEGGETAFPDSNHWATKAKASKAGPFSPCARGAVAFKPKKGDAFMFWSIHPDGRRQDSYSMHTGCPVIKGVKWTATKWIHSKPFRPSTYGNLEPYEIVDPGHCDDHHKLCAEWSKSGECNRNHNFMLGDSMGNPGRCPKSCGSCTPCAKDDRDCYNDNRRRAGFLVYDEATL